jgi:hypothetical protein
VTNDRTLPELYSLFATSRENELLLLTCAHHTGSIATTLENLILLTLYATHGTPDKFTTTEIAARINELWGVRKFKDDVSRYFNQEFHPECKAAKRATDAIEYSLSATGVSAAKRLGRRAGVTAASQPSSSNPANRQLEFRF